MHPQTNETSRVLPIAWIDRLFERFATMYGRHWLEQWAGIDIADVKQSWREDLSFATGEQMRKALDHCKTQSRFPPTCPEFVGLCKAFAPSYEFPALPDHRKSDIDAKVRTEIAKFLTASEKRDPKDWARKILAGEAAGTYRYHYGVDLAKRALGLQQ